MNPRLSTSKKWTEMPPELLSQIREVFVETFSEAAQKGEIIIEGRIYPEELLFRAGYLENGQLTQANFEVSLGFDPAKQNALEQVHFIIDCAASMLNEYLVEKDLEPFPRIWKPLKVEDREIFIQVSTINSKLEAEADRLLGVDSADLVQGETDLEDLVGKGEEDGDGSNQIH